MDVARNEQIIERRSMSDLLKKMILESSLKYNDFRQ